MDKGVDRMKYMVSLKLCGLVEVYLLNEACCNEIKVEQAN